MNYAICNKWLKYSYLLYILGTHHQLFCTILKHMPYENGQITYICLNDTISLKL